MTRNAKTSPTCSERHRNRPPQLCLPNRVRSASCRAGAIRAERMRGRPVRAYPGASRGHAGAHCGAGPRCDDASRSRAVASRQSVRLTIRYRDHQAIKHLARAHEAAAISIARSRVDMAAPKKEIRQINDAACAAFAPATALAGNSALSGGVAATPPKLVILSNIAASSRTR